MEDAGSSKDPVSALPAPDVNPVIHDQALDYSMSKPAGGDKDKSGSSQTKPLTPEVIAKQEDTETHDNSPKTCEDDQKTPEKKAGKLLDDGRQFITPDFQMRIKLQPFNETFTCDVCRQIFDDLDELGEHTKIHYEDSKSKEKPPQQCDYCEKSFTRVDHLRRHIRTHTGEKIVECQICKQLFSRNDHLLRHMRGHHPERNSFECNYCHLLFTDYTLLREHSKTHIIQKPYKCTECDATFTKAGGLRRHMNVHSGAAVHKCDVCGMICSRADHLHRHMRTHSGEKPFKCTLCEKSFTRAEHQRRHERMHLIRSLAIDLQPK